MKLINWFKELFYIVKWYKFEKHRMYKELDEVFRFVKNATTVNADIHFSKKDDTKIIVIGTFKNNDYINCFSIGRNQGDHIIEELRHLRKYHNLGKLDTMPEFRYAIKRELT